MAARRHKVDGIDAESIREMQESRGYALVRRRLTDTISVQQKQLEGDLDALKTAELRGGLRMLRLALDIPRILITEGQKNTNSETPE